jgi:hypothetical protein
MLLKLQMLLGVLLMVTKLKTAPTLPRLPLPCFCKQACFAVLLR